MGRSIVLLNGIPGAGKTTLAGPLAEELGMPLIGKDMIKEALADIVPGRFPTRRIGAFAAESMYRLAALLDGPVLLESFWRSGGDEQYLRDGLQVAGAERVVEVWCEVPLDEGYRRFTTRARHPIHGDEQRVQEWLSWAATSHPCSGAPVITVSTEGPVDVPALAERIRTALD